MQGLRTCMLVTRDSPFREEGVKSINQQTISCQKAGLSCPLCMIVWTFNLPREASERLLFKPGTGSEQLAIQSHHLHGRTTILGLEQRRMQTATSLYTARNIVLTRKLTGDRPKPKARDKRNGKGGNVIDSLAFPWCMPTKGASGSQIERRSSEPWLTMNRLSRLGQVAKALWLAEGVQVPQQAHRVISQVRTISCCARQLSRYLTLCSGSEAWPSTVSSLHACYCIHL